MDQAGDRPRRERREPGGEDAGEGVPEGRAAVHVLSGQPPDVTVADDPVPADPGTGEHHQDGAAPDSVLQRRCAATFGR